MSSLVIPEQRKARRLGHSKPAFYPNQYGKAKNAEQLSGDRETA